MYHYGQRLATETQKYSIETISEETKAYMTALNCILLLREDNAWILGQQYSSSNHVIFIFIY